MIYICPTCSSINLSQALLDPVRRFVFYFEHQHNNLSFFYFSILLFLKLHQRHTSLILHFSFLFFSNIFLFAHI
jgi:hypothetical protein